MAAAGWLHGRQTCAGRPVRNVNRSTPPRTVPEFEMPALLCRFCHCLRHLGVGIRSCAHTTTGLRCTLASFQGLTHMGEQVTGATYVFQFQLASQHSVTHSLVRFPRSSMHHYQLNSSLGFLYRKKQKGSGHEFKKMISSHSSDQTRRRIDQLFKFHDLLKSLITRIGVRTLRKGHSSSQRYEL